MVLKLLIPLVPERLSRTLLSYYREDGPEATYSFSTFSAGPGTYSVKKVRVIDINGDIYELFPNYDVELKENMNEEEDFVLNYEKHCITK